MPVQSIAAKGVLLLRTPDGDHYVCDEYWSSDGRVHILGEHCYGEFNRAEFTLDYRKVAVDIAAIVYSGADWPEPIAGCKDRQRILQHFGRPA